jgi:hypothetical protein
MCPPGLPAAYRGSRFRIEQAPPLPVAAVQAMNLGS